MRGGVLLHVAPLLPPPGPGHPIDVLSERLTMQWQVCLPWSVASEPECGRYLVASRDIQPGELVLRSVSSSNSYSSSCSPPPGTLPPAGGRTTPPPPPARCAWSAWWTRRPCALAATGRCAHTANTGPRSAGYSCQRTLLR